MNSKKEEIRIKPNTKMYDVSSYTDRELLDILDLSSPTDRELEAKIIFLINKYRGMQNDSGDELASFFEDIYSHFFQTSDEDIEDNDEKEDIIEGIDEEVTAPTNKEILTKYKSEIIDDVLRTEHFDIIRFFKTEEYIDIKIKIVSLTKFN